MGEKPLKVCKDGRIWGQNNKEAGNHLGILSGRKYKKGIKKGYSYLGNGLKTHWWRTGKEWKKGMTPWNKGKTFMQKENHPLWKGGISNTPEYFKERDRQRRLEKPEVIKAYKQKYKHTRRKAGVLTLKTIQLIYEDNIKKYGTLTCYLCEKPIEFGNDTLEHKIPISRGGTNDYSNLAVACRSCNSKKQTKTVEEYLTRKVGE